MSAPADVDAGATGEATPARPRPVVVQLGIDRETVVPALAALLVTLHLLLARLDGGRWVVPPPGLPGGREHGRTPRRRAGSAGRRGTRRAVASVAPLSWPALVGLELLGQLLVDLALYRLLVELFGRRPAVLLALTVYLASSLPLVGGLWWSAALVQLPLQLTLLAALTGHVRHLRTGSTAPAVTSALAVAVGLLFSGGMVLVPPLLVVVTLLWATDGALRARLRALTWLRTVWAAQAAAVAVGLIARLLFSAGPLVEGAALVEGARSLSGMLTRTVLPGLVGGPWVWSPVAPPLAVPDPPVALSWAAAVVVTAVVVGSVLVHRGGVRAWLVAAGVAAVPLVGGGLSPTGATDPGRLPAGVVPPAGLALAAALCLGLAFLPLRDAPAVLRRRAWATRGPGLRLTRRLVRTGVGLAVVTTLAVGSLLSTASFGRYWSVNAARGFVEVARADLAGRPGVVLVDTPLPEDVVPAALAPANRASTLLAGLPQPPRFLPDGEVAYQLTTLDEQGHLQLAAVDPVTGTDPGPVADCGWVAGPEAAEIPLQDTTAGGRWMVRLSYLASEGNAVRITVGDTTTAALVGSGCTTCTCRSTVRWKGSAWRSRTRCTPSAWPPCRSGHPGRCPRPRGEPRGALPLPERAAVDRRQCRGGDARGLLDGLLHP